MPSFKEIKREVKETSRYLIDKFTDSTTSREIVINGKYGPIVGLKGAFGIWPKGGILRYMVDRDVSGILTDFGNQTYGVDHYLSELDRRLTQFPNAIVVGYSMGGIIALRYAQLEGWDKFKALVIVGTPLNGVGYLRKLASLGGAFADLAPGSKLLSKLGEMKIEKEKLVGVFAHWDQFVGYGEEIKLDARKIVVPIYGHGSLQNDARWIEDILDREIGITNY